MNTVIEKLLLKVMRQRGVRSAGIDLISHLYRVNTFVSDEKKAAAELKHLANWCAVIDVAERELAAVVARMTRSAGHGG